MQIAKGGGHEVYPLWINGYRRLRRFATTMPATTATRPAAPTSMMASMESSPVATSGPPPEPVPGVVPVPPGVSLSPPPPG